MKLKEQNSIFLLKTFKHILVLFVDIFFSLYFLTISSNNIVTFALYKIVTYITLFLIFYLFKNKCYGKSKDTLLKLGVIFDFIYFLLLLVLNEKIIDYIYLVGIASGLEMGFYYLAFNVIESSKVNNTERQKFNGIYTITKSVISILFPVIFGIIIYSFSFSGSLVLVLLIVIARLFLINNIKENKKVNKKTNIKMFLKEYKGNKLLKFVFKISFLKGLTFSDGAFKLIITLYIIQVFSNSFSLGIITSLLYVISIITGLMYARKIDVEKYEKYIFISTLILIFSLVLMVLITTPVTIILFNLCQTVFKELITIHNETEVVNLSNEETIKNKYKVEYFVMLEFFIFLGRVIGMMILILTLWIDLIYIIPLFIIFIFLYSKNSIGLGKQNRIDL